MILEALGGVLGHLGAVLGRLGAVLAALGPLLGCSWLLLGDLGAFGGDFGSFGGRFGVDLEVDLGEFGLDLNGFFYVYWNCLGGRAKKCATSVPNVFSKTKILKGDPEKV